jgi:hypothetical protein
MAATRELVRCGALAHLVCVPERAAGRDPDRRRRHRDPGDFGGDAGRIRSAQRFIDAVRHRRAILDSTCRRCMRRCGREKGPSSLRGLIGSTSSPRALTGRSSIIRFSQAMRSPCCPRSIDIALFHAPSRIVPATCIAPARVAQRIEADLVTVEAISEHSCRTIRSWRRAWCGDLRRRIALAKQAPCRGLPVYYGADDAAIAPTCKKPGPRKASAALWTNGWVQQR